jgi:hypothetical protein
LIKPTPNTFFINTDTNETIKPINDTHFEFNTDISFSDIITLQKYLDSQNIDTNQLGFNIINKHYVPVMIDGNNYLVPLNSIKHRASEFTPRVKTGDFIQKKVLSTITDKLNDNDYEVISAETAPIGSGRPDIYIKCIGSDGNIHKLYVEVKSSSDGSVRFFDKTVSRENSSPGPNRNIDALIQSNFGYNSLEEYIDSLNGEAGYAGDEGSPPMSGRLTKKYFTLGNKESFLDIIKKHWKNSNDNYFAVSNGSDVIIWHTGVDNENILEEPLFTPDDIKIMWLSTYGSTGRTPEKARNKLRIALTVKLDI